MPFPKKLLGPGEEIVFEARPSWTQLVPRVATAVVVVGACVAIVVVWSSAPLFVGWILLAAGVLSLLALLAKVVSWRAATLTLTTGRIVYRRGVVRRFGREIPLNRVQDVTYRQSLVERLCRSGSLTVESGGDRGQEAFVGIRRPAHVQSLIIQLLSYTATAPRGVAQASYVVARGQGVVGAAENARPQSEQLRRLDDLHRDGVITDAELEAKRRELLGP